MIDYSDTMLAKMSIHRMGDKLQDDFYVLSDQPVEMDDEVLPDLLKHYFLSPFSKVHEVYRFFHPNEALSLNEAYHFIHDFFAGTLGFHEMTTHVCKHLYASSNHPKIKAGEVYIVHLKSVYLEGEEN